MDELSDMLAGSGSISNQLDSSKPANFRSTQYKTKSSNDQKKRREKLLELQKRQRKDVVNQLRKLDDEDWQVFNNELLTLLSEERMDTHTTPAQRMSRPRIYKDQLMLSEWMIEMPSDLESQWIMVPSPVGKRCLVVATQGTTYSYSKSGYCLNRFPSKLPGGCRHKGSGPREGMTMLDCIFSEIDKTFYILDILCWNNHPVIDTETDFRFFWANGKIQETPEAQRISKINPFMFHPLPSYDCKKTTLQQVMMQQHQFKVDGLLFYHRQAHYLCGSTPLVVWLKPYMIPEVLGIDIHEVYKEETPASYTGFQTHLNLIQSDVQLAQKHQDLYVSPNNTTCKAERLIKHQEQLSKGFVNRQIITDATFKHNQSDIRNHQLGLAVAAVNFEAAGESQQISGGSTTGYRFGEAPRADHLSTGSRAAQQAAGAATIQHIDTDMEEKIGVSMRSPLSAHTTWSYAMSKSPTQQQKSQSDPPPNQWNQFR